MDNLTTILAYLGTGVGVSGVLLVIKQKLQLFESKHEKWLKSLLVVFSFIASGAYWVINHSDSFHAIINHFGFISTHAAIIMSVAQGVYWVSINPIYTKFTNLVSASNAYKALTNPAPVVTTSSPTVVVTPATPVPATGTETTTVTPALADTDSTKQFTV